MTAADLRALADVLDRLTASGFAVVVEVGGELIIRAKPAAAPPQSEPFADGTRFDDRTGWVEQTSESARS
jgi:hypothetical protein